MAYLVQWSILIVATLAAAGLSLLLYSGARSVYGGEADEKTVDFARTTIFRIGVLHGLIVALVFADGKENEADVRRAVAEEARTVSNVYYELQRFDRVSTQGIQRIVARYADAVVRFDWPELAQEARLADASWALWDELIDRVLSIEPGEGRRALIHARLVDQVYRIEDLREERAAGARAYPSVLFWVAAIGGLVVMVGCFFAWPPTRATFALIAAFAGYTGLILMLVYDLGNPFDGLSVITPRAFRTFLAEEAGQLL